MALSFMKEIQFTSMLHKWGMTFSEIDEVLDAINSGNSPLVNKLFSQYAPRIRQSRAFKLQVKELQLLEELSGTLFG